MNKSSLCEKIQQFKVVSIILIFLLIICLPTLDSLFHLDTAPIVIEKRRPAQMPVFTGLSGLQDFMLDFEKFFNDHFGFRKRLILLNKRWKNQIFNDAYNDDKGLAGRDGWLFFIGDHVLDNYVGSVRFSNEDLQTWQKLLEKRHDWLAKRGIKYVFTIAPEKHSIYPEYLPDWMIKNTAPTKAEQLLAYMKIHSRVEVLDLFTPLIEDKTQGPLYLKLDTHWNLLGGFFAYQEIVKTLARQLPNLEPPIPLPVTDFNWSPIIYKVQPNTDISKNPSSDTDITISEPLWSGDIAVIMGDTTMIETQHVNLSPKPPLASLVSVTVTERLPKKWFKETNPVRLMHVLMGKLSFFVILLQVVFNLS